MATNETPTVPPVVKLQRAEDAIVADEKLTFSKEFVLIVIGALIIAVSFLWKDYLAAVGEKYFPKSSGLLGMFIYVTLITCVVVFLTMWLRDVFIVKDKNLIETKTKGYVDVLGMKKRADAKQNVQTSAQDGYSRLNMPTRPPNSADTVNYMPF
jgi:hypothetical protein